MKLSVLTLAGIMLALAPAVQAAPMIGNPAGGSLVQQAHVTCAYLTEDGYCVRSHKKHKHWERERHYRPIYRTYEPQDEYYWRYQRPRPIIRVVPSYPRQDEDNWDDWDD
ncbi:hypothetical protein [Mesorhizobium sp.]|uniref:hypothetical protein n=1 Tax=Mesorhizobium sp. TaxID=1871066 RepID=UPI000FE2EACB|nr:hypothetical protein [Mesorhizobium sp.]RWA62878.1 MAG: hypothetical protein EOQ28_30920 [Mesorhizobium sp.]RWB94865.1 MAG: hypothetical protein EOQ57_30825 [Mesorhizobium sp.]RWG82235.1 MAG: hypothetical protein EOQ69_16195 [Mesorhizobium sp.]RWG86914.1 MAG: hypothetical protein EOQ70_14410 [Mesorhizobium sp.]RWJ98069.1 MAG: hypothetical protein EOR42_27830 [Mesorhizobium sp.]